MKKLVLLICILFLSNCSFNSNSKYWTNDVIKKKEIKNMIKKITDKSNDFITLSENEFEIYLNDYVNKSKYPKLKNE
tara:strand:- start:1420 stop:1650 length:231 start_codon:yes stop_codon:yes gene_type:complete